MQFVVNQIAETRREVVGGIEYLIVPTVAIVSGVLNRELVTGDEIGANPDAWNDRPVMLNHPIEDGVFISARDPSILAEQELGRVFGAEFDGEKLRQEMWIPLQQALARGGDFKEAIERFESGKKLVDVSTAYDRDSEDTSGTFQGREYDTIARNIQPDHLAVLLHEPGACSVKDGCGAPRVNTDLATNENALERISTTMSEIAEALKLNTAEVEVNQMDELKAQIVNDGRLGLSIDDVSGLSESALHKLVKFLDDNPAAEQDEVDEEIEEIIEGDEEELEDMEKRDDEEDKKHPPSINVQAPCDQFAEFGGPEAALAKLKEIGVNEEKSKETLIAELVANEKCLLSEEQLSGMTIPTLEAVRNSFTPADYSGQEGGAPVVANSDQTYTMPSMF